MSDSLYLVGLIALTSLVGYFAARRWGRLRREGLGPAAVRLLECVGLVAGFYVLNLLAGFAAVVVLRKATGSFLSLYVNTDGTLALLSALQAVTFQWWRAEGE
jgi:hypothetical protein